MRPVTAPCGHDPPSLVSCWYAIASVGPARQSERPSADASGNRRFVLPPGPETSSVPIAMTALPFKGGRSEAGERSGPSGPSEHRDRGAKVRSRISGESEPPVRRASESLSVYVFTSAATNTMRSMV